jgi:hypothetical protein
MLGGMIILYPKAVILFDDRDHPSAISSQQNGKMHEIGRRLTAARDHNEELP